MINGSYILNLSGLSADLMQHSRAEDMRRILGPASAAEYTGIIIIADERLPIFGRNSTAHVLPCMLPKVWDSDMNLVYELNTIDPWRTLRPYTRDKNEPSALPKINTDENLPADMYLKNAVVRYTEREKIFGPSPSGLDEELEQLVGPRPLRILAQGVYGQRPTDPIINREDARIIFSNEVNRNLLREGRVAIILSKDVLKTPLLGKGN
jgi:hypothetical protein